MPGKLRAAGRRVVQLYEAWGKPAQAARWRKELGHAAPAKRSRVSGNESKTLPAERAGPLRE